MWHYMIFIIGVDLKHSYIWDLTLLESLAPPTISIYIIFTVIKNLLWAYKSIELLQSRIEFPDTLLDLARELGEFFLYQGIL